MDLSVFSEQGVALAVSLSSWWVVRSCPPPGVTAPPGAWLWFPALAVLPRGDLLLVELAGLWGISPGPGVGCWLGGAGASDGENMLDSEPRLERDGDTWCTTLDAVEAAATAAAITEAADGDLCPGWGVPGPGPGSESYLWRFGGGVNADGARGRNALMKRWSS